jgi:hypothetical protein
VTTLEDLDDLGAVLERLVRRAVKRELAREREHE